MVWTIAGTDKEVEHIVASDSARFEAIVGTKIIWRDGGTKKDGRDTGACLVRKTDLPEDALIVQAIYRNHTTLPLANTTLLSSHLPSLCSQTHTRAHHLPH